jgi:hypothetical protein
MINKDITPYDVAMILHCVKMGRLQEARALDDNYVDAINYLAFAAQFAGAQFSTQTIVEDDIAAMAKRFAPVKKEIVNEETSSSASNSFNGDPKPPF